MYYRSFDKIGQKMEEAAFMTPSVYKKNEFDDSYFVAWWSGERGSGSPIDTESDETAIYDFDK